LRFGNSQGKMWHERACCTIAILVKEVGVKGPKIPNLEIKLWFITSQG